MAKLGGELKKVALSNPINEISNFFLRLDQHLFFYFSSRSRPSQTVDSLLSPDTEPSKSSSGGGSGSSRPSGHKRFNRFANISIVEEEEEEEECKEELSDQILALDPPSSTRGLSRHSSTSSLAEKAASIALGSSPNSASSLAASIAAGLRGHLNNPTGAAAPNAGGSSEPSETGGSTPTAIDTPTPFPISSQIGTGGLSISRQNSLRRSEGGGGPSSGASPSSDRKSIPSSPSTPPGSNVSSNQSSPARYKNYLPNKKLVATRSSPQLVLNQIHEEEVDESGGSSASSRAASGSQVDPVDSFPQSAAGAAVIRRLELRRRMHKARTQSCSSSDASDDDSESRKKRNADNAKARTPPTKRDSQHDDSSDSQDPSGVGSSGNPNLLSSSGAKFHSGGRSTGGDGTSQGGSGGGAGGSGGGGGGTKRMHHHGSRRHRAALHQGSRIRQSHSLNRISELHVADFSSDHYYSDDVSNNNNIVNSSSSSVYHQSPLQPPPPPPPPPSSVGHATPPLPPIPPHKQITPQLSTESDSESSNGQRFDMLSRYLESLTVIRSHSNLNNSNCRSRDDSQNSSDGELDQVETICPSSGKVVSRPSAATRRHKVNLRVLEQRLNKIQEECNKSEDEEEGEVDEDGELSDDPSTLPDEAESRQEMNEVENNLRNLDCNTITTTTTQNHTQTIMEICDNDHRKLNNGYCNNQDFFHDTETASTKSCDVLSLNHLRATAAVAVAAAARHHQQHEKKPLHRAHSCGSLMSLKEKAMMAKNLQPLLWDPFELLKGAGAAVPALNEDTGATGVGKKDITLGLATAAATPLTILQLQSSSRCCNLC